MPTFFDNIKSQLKEPLFTADLRAGFPGRYTFGEVDANAYQGEIGFAKISDDSPYWLFDVKGSQVGSASGGNINGTRKAYAGGGVKTIADTGTSLVMLPQVMVDEYYAQVEGAGYDKEWAGMVVPCGRGRRQLPDWSFFIGGEDEKREQQHYKGTVPGRYINFGPVNGTHCFGGIQSADGFGFAVFGDVLLKSQYVVFDVGGGRIGFAGKKLRT
ncbi:putative aspartic proteinase precursor [Cladorrhinum sp. PSN332]|nr:putative aspartic proteinase precursor [Cladorrhinum sp. PSN332]